MLESVATVSRNVYPTSRIHDTSTSDGSISRAPCQWMCVCVSFDTIPPIFPKRSELQSWTYAVHNVHMHTCRIKWESREREKIFHMCAVTGKRLSSPQREKSIGTNSHWYNMSANYTRSPFTAHTQQSMKDNSLINVIRSRSRVFRNRVRYVRITWARRLSDDDCSR